METTETVKVSRFDTKPYDDQKMGTSGLRKKVKVFQKENYLENFVQSIFDAYKPEDYQGKSLVVAGDGRFYNDVVIQKTLKIACAHCVGKIILAENGLMCTPGVSLLIRSLPKGSCFGGFILTASHNPGGPDNDMGIKFNGENGAAIPEHMNFKVWEISKKIDHYIMMDYQKDISLTKPSEFNVERDGKVHNVKIEIESTTEHYIKEMKELFDFDLIKTLFDRKDFKFVYDGLHGMGGPYAIEIFHKIFGVDLKNLHNCDPLPDFGGFHPDPNLHYAKELVDIMDIFNKRPNAQDIPDFGAATDGDADRNMILGNRTFVVPSDSVAVICANAKYIKCLSSGIIGTARSVPTSSAVDRVAKKMGIPYYEVPTGWKFFGNLLDAKKINLCGEEAFGTGSSHVREKDGLWAVLCWLSILAHKNKDNTGKLIGVRDVLEEHFKTYGREYYRRHDYENLTNEQAEQIKANLVKNFEMFDKMKEGNHAYIFEYKDPVDGLESKNQGWIYKYADGSRIVFRVSGTSSTNVTIRIYLEKHMEPTGEVMGDIDEMLVKGDNFVEIAEKISHMKEITGRKEPNVIT